MQDEDIKFKEVFLDHIHAAAPEQVYVEPLGAQGKEEFKLLRASSDFL